MARFRATIQGCRGMASRLGGEKSGIDASINGWNIGISVRAYVNDKGQDIIEAWTTNGSGYNKNLKSKSLRIEDK